LNDFIIFCSTLHWNTASSFLQQNLGFLVKKHGRTTVWGWLVINQQRCPVPFKIGYFLIHKIIQNYISPVVLYGCQSWSLTLREEHVLGVSENRVLRKLFVPKRVEVTGEWRRLHNKELYV
jgi:hypothetical protein